MFNIKENLKGNVYTLTIDLSAKTRTSKSGKSKVIASTEGNVGIGKDEIKLGLNLYKAV